MLSSLILYNNQPFLNWIVTCEKKVDFIWWPVTTSSVVEPRRRPKALPKAKLGPKKCHDHSLVICCQPDTLQLSESQQNHYIWEVCSANQWDAPKTATAAAGIGQQKGPSPSHLTHCMSHNQCFKSWTNWTTCEVLPHLSYSPDLLPTLDYHFFKHLNNFLQGKCFHNQQEAENAFQEFIKFRSRDFLHYRKKQTNLFLAGKNVLIVSS